MNFKDFKNNKSVFTTSFVTSKNSEIIFFSIDNDLDMQFFSKEGADMREAKLVSLGEILKIDNTLKIIGDFEKGDKFYRKSKDDKWQKVL